MNIYKLLKYLSSFKCKCVQYLIYLQKTESDQRGLTHNLSFDSFYLHALHNDKLQMN